MKQIKHSFFRIFSPVFLMTAAALALAQEPACLTVFSKPAHVKRKSAATQSQPTASRQRRRSGVQQKYITLEEAKAYIRNFPDVDSSRKYHRFIHSPEGHPLMPFNPDRTYKKQGWVDWADFLGTDNKNHIQYKSWLPLKEVQAYMRKYASHIKTRKQYRLWRKLDNREFLFPYNPVDYYKDQGWVRWGVFLGTNRISSLEYHKRLLPLDQASRIVQKQRPRIKSSTQYRKWHLKTKPKNLPLNPHKSYESQGWNGWVSFLGFEELGEWNKKDRLLLEEARLYMRSQGITNLREFDKWKKEGKRPDFIPANPFRHYGKELKEKGGLRYFLGINKLHYEDTKELIQILGIETRKEYEIFAQTKPYSDLLPLYPQDTYKKFEGWRIFLGQYMPFRSAKIYARKLGLNRLQFLDWLKSDARPLDFPENPQEYYKEDWPGLTAFLGIRWMPLEEAQELIQGEGLISSEEFLKWIQDNKDDLPENFPTNPPAAYEKQWPGWPAFLGLVSEGEVSDSSSKKSAENFSDTEKDLEKEFRKRPVEEQKHIL